MKYLYALPWTRVADLIADHPGLQRVLGAAPSHWALYRFAAKVRANKPVLDACLTRVAESLRAELPGIGTDVAIDASDLPAYGNGQRYIFQNGPERQVYSDATRVGDTAARSAPGPAEASMATKSTRRFAPRPGCRSRGRFAPPAATKACSSRR